MHRQMKSENKWQSESGIIRFCIRRLYCPNVDIQSDALIIAEFTLEIYRFAFLQYESRQNLDKFSNVLYNTRTAIEKIFSKAGIDMKKMYRSYSPVIYAACRILCVKDRRQR